MTMAATIKCAKCAHSNPADAKFCNNCGAPLTAAAPATPVHVAELKGKTLAGAHGGEHAATHHSDKFYGGVFLGLGVITIVEVFLANIGNAPIRYGSLIILSILKFAMVVMFFMHMKGDKRLYAMVFVGPLLLGAVMLLSLAALFSKFNP